MRLSTNLGVESVRSFPLFLKLDGRQVLLAGGSSAAAAKLRLLMSAGARVTVVAETPSPDLMVAIDQAGARLVQSALDPAHVTTVDLVFGATDSEDSDRKVADLARAAGKLVNIVDLP